MKVLLIEDSATDAVLIASHLERVPEQKIEVSHAWRLQDGMESLERECWDAVLLDLGLPDSIGLDTLREIKLAGNNVPVIVLTGDLNEDMALEAVKHGAQDYLNKNQLSGPVLVRSLFYANERHRLQKELQFQAYHDPLTGLSNRKYFDEHIEAVITRSREGNHRFAVLLLDLDGFKIVNDLDGHEAGDQLLIQTASRLKTCTRKGDVLSRLGGDEFALLIDGATSRDDTERAAARIKNALETPFEIGTGTLTISASIGIVMADEISAETPAEMRSQLLKHADMAMYAAKATGTGRRQYFDQELSDALSQRSRIELALHNAEKNDELLLHYQPIIDFETKKPVGLEALCRWKPTGQPLIPPDIFIPVAEKTGLIIPIGRWVIRRACQDFAAWKNAMSDSTCRYFTMHVNVSPLQLSDESLVPTIADSLRHWGMAPEELVVEVTESCFGDNTGLASKVLSEIRDLGVGLSIDDFGAGYSSLGQLRRLPFTGMKIDRSFIAQLGDQYDEGDVMLEAMTTLATALNLSTVAEGIETESQAQRVRDAGCQYAQGFLFARPAPIEDVIEQTSLRRTADSCPATR